MTFQNFRPQPERDGRRKRPVRDSDNNLNEGPKRVADKQVEPRQLQTKETTDPFFQTLQQLTTLKTAPSNAPEKPVPLPSVESLMEPDALPVALKQPPLDWSIKSKCRFTSSSSFSWCSTVRSVEQEQGMKSFLSAEALRLTQTQTPSIRELQEDFHNALLYWVHPSSSLTVQHPVMKAVQRAAVKAPEQLTSEDTVCTSYIHTRWLDWESSFTSIYYRLRNNECNWFYYQTSQYLILFLSAMKAQGNQTETDFQAIFTKSSKGLRSLLQKRGVTFTMPFRRENDVEVSHSEDLENKKLQKLLVEESRIEDEGTLSSALLVTGKHHLHALYDVLLNYNKRTEDVPVLYSSVSFVNASLRQLSVIKVGELRSADQRPSQPDSHSNTTNTSNNTDTGNNIMEHFIDIAGPILPNMMVKLFHVFRASQPGGFRCRLWSEGGSVNFNAFALPHLSRLEFPCSSLCHYPQAQTAFRTTSRTPASVKRVRCEAGVYSVSLA